MSQFLSETLDQLDLALDQLALNDRNYDRFAMMLVDNAVELTLHNEAEKHKISGIGFNVAHEPTETQKLAGKALGHNFDEKVKFARYSGLVSSEIAESVLYLHQFRNTAYHKGQRHNGILHSLTLFYLENACEILQKYQPSFWIIDSGESLTHRARKYMGEINSFDYTQYYSEAWKRLSYVAKSISSDFVGDLTVSMEQMIESANKQLIFLVENSPNKLDRSKAVVSAQEHAKFRMEKMFISGETYTSLKGGLGKAPFIKSDPIPGWRKRLQSLQKESDKHLALKKYSDFVRQTEYLRCSIEDFAGELDVYIEHQIDLARGK